MPIDASLFMQFAQNRDAQAAQLGQDLGNAVRLYQQGRQTKRQLDLEEQKLQRQQMQDMFDVEKGAQRAILKGFSGAPLDDQDKAFISAYDALQGQKVVYQPDANGQVRAVTQPSIMDRLMSQRGGFQGAFPPINAPAGQTPSVPNQPPVGSSEIVQTDMGAVPPVSAVDLIVPVERVPLNPPSALTPQQQQALQARGDVFNQPAAPLPSGGIVAPRLPYGATKLDLAAGQAQIDLQKKAIENKMAREEKTKEPIGLEQGKVATFADRMIDANNQLENLVQSQTDLFQRGVADVPVFGNYATSSDYKKASQAERNFINAVLRRESGAVISPEEFANARQQYFPQPGDDEPVIQQKAMNRQTVIEGFVREAGPSYKPKNPSILGLPEGATKTARTSGGKPVYQTPDGKLFVVD